MKIVHWICGLFKQKTVANNGDVTQGEDMGKEQMVSDFVQAVKAAEDQILSDKGGALYDGAYAEGVASVPPGTGGDPSKIFSQEELDAKLAEALAADEVIDQEKLAQAHAEAQAQIDAVNASLAEMTAKYETEHGALQGFKDKVDGLQSALDVLKNLINPPAPAPQPEPQPEPQA